MDRRELDRDFVTGVYGKEEGNQHWQKTEEEEEEEEEEKKEGEKLRHIQGMREGDGEESGNLLALAWKEKGGQLNDRSGGSGKQEGRGGEPEPAREKRQVPIGGFQGAKGRCHCSSQCVRRRSGGVPGAWELLPRPFYRERGESGRRLPTNVTTAESRALLTQERLFTAALATIGTGATVNPSPSSRLRPVSKHSNERRSPPIGQQPAPNNDSLHWLPSPPPPTARARGKTRGGGGRTERALMAGWESRRRSESPRRGRKGSLNTRIMGHGNGELPDYRQWKIEGTPLQNVQERLAKLGLKDPWLRNEAWRFSGGFAKPATFLDAMTKGFKWGFAAFVVALAVEYTFFPPEKNKGHH
ncbi:NADH dehydrogenase [Crotalus adamanteus]|uniref:NADH dehydrogenase [ubiquinone] 1 beta subcomplex subunit 3 n=3 Tax=Crotalus TaxID=8728 RepID=A0AAW1C952_CROAD